MEQCVQASEEKLIENPEGLWQQHALEEEVRGWSIGSLNLWSKKKGKELWIASERKAENATNEETPSLPENPSWSRWVLKNEIKDIKLKPVFPDRPITIKPEQSLRVSKGSKIRIYVRVPLWLRVEIEKKITIFEIPTVVLSKTYFGTYMEGARCYWISSGVRSEITPDLSRPYLAICPLQIINRSEEELFIGKICLRVEELSLYLSDGQLWANDTTINYRGSEDISHIEIGKKAPQEVEKGTLVSPPRSLEQRKGFAAKTFQTLKDLPGVGFLLKYGE